MNPKGWSVTSSPTVTPINESGTVSQITNGRRSELNSATTVRIMTTTNRGMLPASEFCAFWLSRYSPHHSSM